MTRSFRLVLAATAVLAAACSAPEGEKAAASPPPPSASPAAPLAVHVALPEGASAETTQWARDLEAAIREQGDDLELVPDADAASLVVRVTSVEKGSAEGVEAPGEGEAMVMRGVLVVGEATRDFNLSYRGEARTQAEALARNLRHYHDEMKKGAMPTAP